MKHLAYAQKVVAGLATAALLFSSAGPALALSQSEAKDQWIQAQKLRLEADATYRQAILDYQQDKTPENDKKVIDSAKAVLDAALDEAEAWLKWKQLEAQEDSRVPADIKANINADVEKNLAKIVTLRADVAGIENRLQAAAVFLKIVGSYAGLLADVARNTGAMWSYIGTTLTASAEEFEAKLRTAASGIADNAEILAKLDAAKSDIGTAKSKIALAKTAYENVKLPGIPLVKFAEGNAYLRQARVNLINAQVQLAYVLRLISAK